MKYLIIIISFLLFSNYASAEYPTPGNQELTVYGSYSCAAWRDSGNIYVYIEPNYQKTTLYSFEFEIVQGGMQFDYVCLKSYVSPNCLSGDIFVGTVYKLTVNNEYFDPKESFDLYSGGNYPPLSVPDAKFYTLGFRPTIEGFEGDKVWEYGKYEQGESVYITCMMLEPEFYFDYWVDDPDESCVRTVVMPGNDLALTGVYYAADVEDDTEINVEPPPVASSDGGSSGGCFVVSLF